MLTSATTYTWRTWRRTDYHWIRLPPWVSVESIVGGYNPTLAFKFPRLWTI